MVLIGSELSDVLGRSGNEIELRNQYGRCCRILSRDQARELDPDLFVGIGNLRRIRFLRPREFRTSLNAGSHNTERMKGRGDVNIAHPLIKQHRPMAGARK